MVSLDRNNQSVMYHKQDIIQIEDKNNIRLKYFITFLSIGQCGIGFLSSKEVYIFTAILLLLLTFLKPSAFSFLKVLPWVLANLLIYLFQTIAYDAFEVGIVQLGYFIIRLIVPAMYLVIVGKEYYKYYIKILYIYTLISFVFWTIEVVLPPLSIILRKLAINFSQTTGSFVVDYKGISFYLLYTFTYASSYHILPRNAGPFWEPGAFAVYLAVALVFVYLSTRSLKNKYILVFSLAILTTQSTAGYISLYIFWVWAILSSNTKYKSAMLIIVLISAFLVSNSAPFMKLKLTEAYEQEMSQPLTGFTSGRMYSARKSINAIGQHPFIGRGISRRTAYDEYSEFYGSYGIIDIPARFGIIMGSIYFILLLYSLRIYASLFNNKNKWLYALGAFFTLIPVYLSQGVYLSVVNLLILQTTLVYRDLTKLKIEL